MRHSKNPAKEALKAEMERQRREYEERGGITQQIPIGVTAVPLEATITQRHIERMSKL